MARLHMSPCIITLIVAFRFCSYTCFGVRVINVDINKSLEKVSRPRVDSTLNLTSAAPVQTFAQGSDRSTGILEVHLVNAKNLKSEDIIGNMDPYVTVQYGQQECKSRVAADQGRNPVWNQKFKFRVNPGFSKTQYKIILIIKDKDSFKEDDFVGESVVYVNDVISSGLKSGTAELQSQAYRVVLANKSYYGEIRVGVFFTTKYSPTGCIS